MLEQCTFEHSEKKQSQKKIDCRKEPSHFKERYDSMQEREKVRVCVRARARVCVCVCV